MVVISHQMWVRQFNADPAILGKNPPSHPAGHSARWTSGRDGIVGVMGAAFKGVSSPWQPTNFWVPIVQRASDYTPPPPPYLGHPYIYRSRLGRGPITLLLVVSSLAKTEARAQVVVQTFLGEQLKQPLRNGRC